MKVQFNEVNVGDIVTVRYADETCSYEVARIEEQFQKNGTRQIILYREDGRMIWVAKETTKITCQRKSVDYEIDYNLSSKLSKIFSKIN